MSQKRSDLRKKLIDGRKTDDEFQSCLDDLEDEVFSSGQLNERMAGS